MSYQHQTDYLYHMSGYTQIQTNTNICLIDDCEEICGHNNHPNEVFVALDKIGPVAKPVLLAEKRS